jgi:hypothetical protein
MAEPARGHVLAASTESTPDQSGPFRSAYSAVLLGALHGDTGNT